MQLLVQERLPVDTRPEPDVNHRSVLYQLVERFRLCSIPGCCSGTTVVTVVPLVWILGRSIFAAVFTFYQTIVIISSKGAAPLYIATLLTLNMSVHLTLRYITYM